MVRLGDEYEREDGVRPGQEEDDEEDPNFTVLNETDSDEDPVGDEADPPSSFWESVRSHPWLRGEPIVIEDPPSPPPTPPVLPSAPTLVTEYMDMGDLHQFRKRLKAAGINPPTRFLWRVLLCLLRACTGLAYYDENPDPRGRENIPEGINPDDLAHGYLDLSHLLIGELQPDDDIDHNLVPLIKMCSFGETMDRPDMGMRENQLAIGRIIQTLAVPSSEAPDQQEDGLMPRGNARVPTSRGGRRISSYVHRDFWGAEHITFRFKAIVALLMARRNQDRRSLEDILLMVFEVNTESAEDNFNGYPVPADETDEGIAQFVRQYMFEASSNPPPLTTATLADGDDGDEDISRGPGPLSSITTWVGTGGSRGPDDLDPASFDIPDLPIGPLPPGSPTGRTRSRSQYIDAQQEEIGVLKAIYEDGVDFIEHKAANAAWQRSEPSFDIRIKALSNQDFTVTLGVVLTATYPKSAPLLSLKDDTNLSESTLFKIQKFIEKKPKDLAAQGQCEPMIHELALGIHEDLEDAALAKAQGLTLPSLEEERAAHEAELARQAQEQEEEEARKKQEASLEEERVMQQMIDEEMRRKKESSKKSRQKSHPKTPSFLPENRNTVWLIEWSLTGPAN
ncbi:hypothetical protein PG987_009371 [Apiospora arundinis]